MENKDIRQQVSDMIIRTFIEDYSKSIFTSQLYEMFGKCDSAVKAYIKPGREFWHYDGSRRDYRKLTVTYVRTGVMFFVFNDEPDVEHAWFIGSFNCLSLYAAQIYPYEIGRIMFEHCRYGAENAIDEFPKICEMCKWDDCNGSITVDVIWDEQPSVIGEIKHKERV